METELSENDGVTIIVRKLQFSNFPGEVWTNEQQNQDQSRDIFSLLSTVTRYYLWRRLLSGVLISPLANQYVITVF